MRLLLIRHGETVDNVAAIYAGVRDSALTTHGVLQTQRLASYLASAGVKITHIYSSDLQRAFKTAEAVRIAQSPAPAETVKLEMLREQDFGWWEGKFIAKGGRDAQREKYGKDEGFADLESKASMKARMAVFIDSHLVDHMHNRGEKDTVAVVAHGIILSFLWRGILRRFDARDVSLDSGAIDVGHRGLEYLGGWSNTGYLDLEIKSKPSLEVASVLEPNAAQSDVISVSGPKSVQDDCFESLTEPINPPMLADLDSVVPPLGTAISPIPQNTSAPASIKLLSLLLVVKDVNCQEHLRGLKKTRGGIGSSKHDDKQQTVDSFFKKRKAE